MITHIGGLDCVADTVVGLPGIPGGKKLIYTGIKMPLTALDELEAKGRTNRLFAVLSDIVARNIGLWCAEAEKYLLEHAERI
jgi:hypothetical protein